MAGNRQTKRQVMAVLEQELTKEEYKSLVMTKGTHPAVILTIGQKKLTLSFPSSPSDARWFLNWRGYFRREYRRIKGA